MLFDPNSMSTIAQSLTVLECEDNYLENLEFIDYLSNLRYLRLKDN